MRKWFSDNEKKLPTGNYKNYQFKKEKELLLKNIVSKETLKFEVDSQFKVAKQINFALKSKINLQDACSQQLAWLQQSVPPLQL